MFTTLRAGIGVKQTHTYARSLIFIFYQKIRERDGVSQGTHLGTCLKWENGFRMCGNMVMLFNFKTVGALAAGLAVLFLAAPMSFAALLRTVTTASSQTVEFDCPDEKGWTFEVTTGIDAGRDVVTVKMSAATEAIPPTFKLSFRASGADIRHVWVSDYKQDAPRFWLRGWKGPYNYASQLAKELPVAVAFNQDEASRLAVACSEAMHRVDFELGSVPRTSDALVALVFFRQGAPLMKEYSVSMLVDGRTRPWYETVRDSADWISRVNGFVAAPVPEAAFDPLYSTWYAFWQDVHADVLEEEARLAAAVGMKTMILDDGWQKAESKSAYSATGDWLPVASRFPDMRGHVEAVHRAGLKYMLWLSVPYVGSESAAYRRFKDKILKYHGNDSERGFHAVLDPRYQDVREYLLATYERVVRDWDFDGVKLDFIDQFTLPDVDPAVRTGYAGCDFKSVPLAVDHLMKEVVRRLRAIKPDVLIEFRQSYIGPAILQYGNMMRACDCPSEPDVNRKRIADLRLTSGKTAVHADMLVWSKDERPEGAAKPILSALFGVIQYSMVLKDVPATHRDVIRHWLDFSQTHRETLLKGEFRPHHPELNYPYLEAESAVERIAAVYTGDWVVRLGMLDKPVCLINATERETLVVEIASETARGECFDTFGRAAGTVSLVRGLNRVPIPESGYLKIHK